MGLSLAWRGPAEILPDYSNLSSNLVGKRTELLKEVVPELSRLAVFGTSSNRDTAREVKEIESTVAAFRMRAQYYDVLAPKDIALAFRAAAKARSDAVQWIVSGRIGRPNRKEAAELAIKYRLPTIFTLREHVEVGGLMNYGVYLPDLDRRAATYVHKILNGAKPADLSGRATHEIRVQCQSESRQTDWPDNSS